MTERTRDQDHQREPNGVVRVILCGGVLFRKVLEIFFISCEEFWQNWGEEVKKSRIHTTKTELPVIFYFTGKW